MKGYRFTINYLEHIYKDTKIEFGSNLHTIKDITNNSYFLLGSDEGRKGIIKQLAFKVEEECDCLQSIRNKNKEGLYGFVSVSFNEEAKTIAEQNIMFHTKGLEYWNKPKEEQKGFFYEAYTRTYPSAEFPYEMYFYGGDDASYTRCFSSMKEVDLLLKLISDEEQGIDTYEFFKDFQFEFTN